VGVPLLNSKHRLCALLLFSSGLCALIYQVSWIRQFRAIFGVSTQASAAVMAIFMGGLGLGALFLGKRTDRHAAPLRLYAQLEAGIALLALVSPLWMMLGRKVYIGLGGVSELGSVGATLLRLLLAALIIGPPTFLMGGTLPALTRALAQNNDSSRLRVGFLYGSNTLGAFCGGLLAAFYLHERLGVRATLIWACLFNGVVALVAFKKSKTLLFSKTHEPTAEAQPGAAPRVFVLMAVTCTGLLFLLQEMVWYRMLSPLLGGSTYTISLILCGALLGIGLGGILYPILWRRRSPGLADFALTCAAQALLIGIPFALGDSLAVWAANLGGPTFSQLVWGWLWVIFWVVFPGSLASGVQFPLLIALLGKGSGRVGADIGLATVLNSLGSIAGSLAGGFGLMVLLGSVGVWRLVIGASIVLALIAFGMALKQKRSSSRDFWPLVMLIPAIFLLFADGPGAPWKHAGIGVGRSGLRPDAKANQVHDWINVNRRQIIWEQDGIESSIGISDLDGYAFIVNGKTDGNAIGDAATQVMSGLVGAALHPNPKTALVVGLGTGSTAGWLGKVESLERVDVVELEPAVLHMAQLSTAVNEDVLHNPKVNTLLGDAREFLLTSKLEYDLIFSEPSNPYRAGISSMYTREYYRDVAARLKEGGIFLQWLQGYSVDSITIQRVYSTLMAQFPHVETWISGNRDLILVASAEPLLYDSARLRQTLEAEPFARAMQGAWRVASLEGFLSRYYAGEMFSMENATFEPWEHNSDDRPYIEFAMARSISRGLFDPYKTWADIPENQRRPSLNDEKSVAWDLVDEYRVNLITDGLPIHRKWFSADGARADSFRRMEALMIYFGLERSEPGYEQQLDEAFQLIGGETETPRMRDGWLLVGEWAANHGRLDLLEIVVAYLSEVCPAEAEVLMGMALANRNPHEASNHLLKAFLEHETDPWPRRSIIEAALMLTPWLAENDPSSSLSFYKALQRPFAVESLKFKRLTVLTILAEIRGFDADCGAAFTPMEPYIPWDREFLGRRADCYKALGLPEAEQAAADVVRFRQNSLKLR